MTTEPADGGYVLMKLDEANYEVWRRFDDWVAEASTGDRRWFNLTDHTVPPLTWAAVTDLGEIGIVGEIKDRRVEFEGEPWVTR